MKSNTPTPPLLVEVKLESTHSLFFDGAYKRIIDRAAAGMVVYDPLGNNIYLHGKVLESSHSNKETKYQALIAALEWCVRNGVKRLIVYRDALLLMKQINGTQSCKKQTLLSLLKKVKSLMRLFKGVQL